MPTPLRTRALTAILTLGTILPPALAQPPTTPPTARQTPEDKTAAARATFQQALDTARAQRRVLVVTYSNSQSNVKANRAMLASIPTQAWLDRHALVIDITDQPLIVELIQAGMPMQPGLDPLLLIDGKPVPIVAPHNPSRKAPPETLAGSLALAQRLDWSVQTSQLDNAKSFADDNTRAAQQVKLQLPPPLHTTGTGTGKDRIEPFAPDPAKPADILAVLAEARANFKSRPLHAAAIYTWLWEAGDAANPAFTPTRLSTIAAEMHALAKANPPVATHFRALRDAQARRTDLRTYASIYEYLILNRVIEDHLHNLEFYDASLARDDAKAIIPPDDAEAHERLLPLCHFNDPTQNASDPWRAPVRFLNRANNLQARKDQTTHAELIDFYRWLARLEAARRYAWVLPAPNDPSPKPARAQAIIQHVLPMDDTPEFRNMLTLAARASAKAPPADLQPKP